MDKFYLLGSMIRAVEGMIVEQNQVCITIVCRKCLH